VTDANGCKAGAAVSVNATDNTPPVVRTNNLTVYLDNSGQATITVAQVDNGSTDNCGIASRVLTRSGFTCSDLGGSSSAINPVNDGTISIQNAFIGAGYTPNTNELLMPQWSGNTV